MTERRIKNKFTGKETVLPESSKPELLLTYEERMALKVLTLELELVTTKMDLLKSRKLLHLARIDPTGVVLKLEEEVVAAVDARDSLKPRYDSVINRVKDRLSLTADFNFDPDTGSISLQGAESLGG